MDSMIGILFFLIPGFISLEISRFFYPEYPVKSGEDKIWATFVFTLIIYFLIFLSNPNDFTVHFQELLRGNFKVFQNLILLIAIFSISSGIIWGVGKPQVSDRIYKIWTKNLNEKGLTAYSGGEPFFNKILRDYPQNWCEVFTRNDKCYICAISRVSFPPGKQGIFIVNVLEVEGKEMESIDLQAHHEGVYIPYEEIVSIYIRKQSEDNKQYCKEEDTVSFSVDFYPDEIASLVPRGRGLGGK